MSRRDEQLARMKGLMTYGMINENKKTPVKDFIEGADGKIYAIIREGAKYHIKTTSKGKELVTESFDYIGGFMNKKNNEYSSYNQASKNLELKMRSLNEAYGINKPVELLNPEKKENLVLEMTDAMKSSIARYRQIMYNTAGIMNESTISASNTGNPEAPKTTTFSPKLGEPFTNTAEAKLDKDLKVTANDVEKQGEPFGDKEKSEDYTDAQYVPDGSVANQKPTGGKVVRVNENNFFHNPDVADDEQLPETPDEIVIDECDEWGSCGLPSNPGVGEVGDDAPFTIKEDENDIVGFADEDVTTENDELNDIDIDLDDIDDEEEDDIDINVDDDLDDIDSEEVLDSDDMDTEEEPVEEENEIEVLKKEIRELRDLIMQKLGDNEPKDEVEDEVEDENDEEDYEIELDFDPTMYESMKSHSLNEEGTKLNVFGKHPGYRKKPMTLPQTGSDNEGNVRDWNDNSVYSEQPFGEKIGTSAPFDKIVNEIVESIKKKL